MKKILLDENRTVNKRKSCPHKSRIVQKYRPMSNTSTMSLIPQEHKKNYKEIRSI